MTEARLAVVSTVFDEAANIERFVTSLLEQTVRPDQIVIVDGGSTDGTWETLLALGAAHPQLTVRSAPGANISRGRNLAIGETDADLIAVTDAGTDLDPCWLVAITAALRADDGVDVVAGWFEPGGGTDFGRLLAAITLPLLDEIDPEAFLPSSRSVAFRRGCWARVGGYPEWLQHCEDLVFDIALKEAGCRFHFAPDAVVTWEARSTLRQFFRQYRLYARGDAHALLWPRRHALRYAAYGIGLLLAGRAFRGDRQAQVALVIGGLGWMSRYLRRLAVRSPVTSIGRVPVDVMWVPVIQVTGDVAKMIGYALGRVERALAGGPAGLEAVA